ncbi:hypothetical protein GIJ48_16990 [Escherichia coli]|nr:hypothetical protein [Escherichia coli]
MINGILTVVYYSIFIITSSFLLLLSSVLKKTNIFFYLAVFFSVFFSGFRFNAGNDFPTYYAMAIGWVDYSRLEFIPRIIMELSVYLNSPSIFFFITSVIYITCVSLFCRKMSENKELSFFLFLVLPLSFLTSLGYVRQFISIGFFIAALSFYIENKRKTSILFMIFSVLCHATAVFAIPFIFLFNILSRRKVPLFISIILIMISYASSKLIYEFAYLTGDYQHYITGTNVVEAGKKIGYVCISLLAYFYIFGKKINKEKDIYFFNIFLIFCCIYVLLMDFGEYVVRIAYFFFPAAWILFPKTIRFKGLAGIFQAALIVIFGLLMYYATLYFALMNTTRDFLTNYSFIFFN